MKANEDNPEFARRFGWLLVAAKATRRKLAMLREPSDPRKAAALNSRMGRWERDGKAPDRATLLWLLAVIVAPEAREATIAWLLDRGPVPLWLRGRVPEGFGGSVIPDVSPAIAPAQPIVRGATMEAVVRDAADRAIEAIRRGEDWSVVSAILDSAKAAGAKLRELGFASIVSFGMLTAAVESAKLPGSDDPSRSGGIGRRARFRGVRTLPRTARPRKLKQSSSARRRRGEIIRLDDPARTPALPKSALRPHVA